MFPASVGFVVFLPMGVGLGLAAFAMSRFGWGSCCHGFVCLVPVCGFCGVSRLPVVPWLFWVGSLRHLVFFFVGGGVPCGLQSNAGYCRLNWNGILLLLLGSSTLRVHSFSSHVLDDFIM